MFLRRSFACWVLLLTGKIISYFSTLTTVADTSSRLDGLNKELSSWDSSYYMGEFRSLCIKEKMKELQWPERDYIVQIARFDPAKGIPNVIDSYSLFRKHLASKAAGEQAPQLLICGHGAVDDPDASIIYDQVIQLIHSDKYKEYADDIVVMRIPPSDQCEFFPFLSPTHDRDSQ